jgi:hypothetical protein
MLQPKVKNTSWLNHNLLSLYTIVANKLTCHIIPYNHHWLQVEQTNKPGLVLDLFILLAHFRENTIIKEGREYDRAIPGPALLDQLTLNPQLLVTSTVQMTSWTIPKKTSSRHKYYCITVLPFSLVTIWYINSTSHWINLQKYYR